MQTEEYKASEVDLTDIDGYLNFHAREGWTLVSISTTHSSRGYLVVLKRPVAGA